MSTATPNGIASPAGPSGGGVFTRLQEWAKHPFSTDMDLVHWALFTGLILVVATLWIMAIGKMSEEL